MLIDSEMKHRGLVPAYRRVLKSHYFILQLLFFFCSNAVVGLLELLPAIHLLQRFLTCICLLSSWKHFEILPKRVLSGGRTLLGSLQSPSPASSPPCNNNNLSGRCLPGPRHRVGGAGRRGPEDLTFSIDSSSRGRKCNGRLGADPSSSTATYLPAAAAPCCSPSRWVTVLGFQKAVPQRNILPALLRSPPVF